MKRVLVMIVTMVFLFAMAVSAEEANRQIYVNSDMNMILYIDQPTLQYANVGNILLTKEPITYQEGNQSVSGGFMTVFYALGNVDLLSNESAATYEDALRAVKKYATPVLAFTMTNGSKVPTPTELLLMDSQILQMGERLYSVYKINPATYNALDAETRKITDTALNCFSDLSTSVNITEPSSDRALGDFQTTDISGDPRDFQIFSGYKLTMVNVWATYCSPCLEEMPALAEISNQYRNTGIQVVGIVSDVREGSAKDDDMMVLAREIAEKTGASGYINLVPDSTIILNKLKEMTAVPTTFFVDENGRQVGEIHVGAKNKEQWIRILEDTLALVK